MARSKPKGKYRSTFESDVAKQLPKDFEYEPKDKMLSYVVPETYHNYTCDFVSKNVYLECKGYWDKDSRDKMNLIKQQYPEIRIIMVFQNPKLKIYKGSKTTYADWCDKNGIEWCTLATLKQLLGKPQP